MKLRIAVEVETTVETIGHAATLAANIKKSMEQFGTVNKWSEKVINR